MCWWAFKLFQHSGHYKHESVGISLKIARLYDNSALNFLRSTHIVFHNGCTVFHSHSHSPVCKDSSFSTFSTALIIILFFYFLTMCVVSCSVMSHSLQPHGIVAHQAPLSMGFSRQEYWSGLSCLPLGDLPNPGIEPRSPALQTDSLPSEPPSWWMWSEILFWFGFGIHNS